MPARLLPPLERLPSPLLHAALLGAFLSFTQVSSAAQDTGSEGELRTMRLQLRQDLLSSILPEKRVQREELVALEKRLAAAQDFAGAIRARDERLKVEQEIANIEKEVPALRAQMLKLAAGALPERIELKLTEASLTGVKLDEGTGSLQGWNAPGASASWKLPDLPPGGYEVLLRYTADGGGVTLQESFYSLSAECSPPVQKATEKSLGTLRIRDGSGPLTLKSNPPEKSSSLRVYSLVLVPASR